MIKQPDYPVLIPYSDLCELLNTCKLIKGYETQVKALERQVLALRVIQQECIEQLRELKKLV